MKPAFWASEAALPLNVYTGTSVLRHAQEQYRYKSCPAACTVTAAALLLRQLIRTMMNVQIHQGTQQVLLYDTVLYGDYRTHEDRWAHALRPLHLTPATILGSMAARTCIPSLEARRAGRGADQSKQIKMH